MKDDAPDEAPRRIQLAPDGRRRRRRWTGAVAVVAAGALTATGLVLTGGQPDHRRAMSPAVRAAIKQFAVKPLDLTKITFAPKSKHTPVLRFGGKPSAPPGSTAPGGGASGGDAAGGDTAKGSGGSGGGTGSGATSTTVGGGTTTTLPPSTGATKTAPPGFAGQLVDLYRLISNVNQKAASLVSLPAGAPKSQPVSRFAQAVQNVPSQDLDILYTATVDNSSWASVEPFYQHLRDELATTTPKSSSTPKPSNATAATSGTAGVSPSVSPRSVQPRSTGGSSPYPYPNSSTTTTFTPAVTATTDPSLNESNCPSSVTGGDYGEDAIYGAEVAVDTFTTTSAAIPQQLTIGEEAVGEGTVETIPDPAWIVSAVLQGEAQVTHDTFAFIQAIWNDCNNTDQQAEVTDIYHNIAFLTALVDSRTTALENEAEAIYALVDTQTTQILNALAVVQATINLQIKIVIEQDLLQGASGSVAEVQIPASHGGYLDAVPIGVQKIVTDALSQMQQAGEAVNPAAPGDLAAANAALGAGHYKQAFSLYSQAYEEIVE